MRLAVVIFAMFVFASCNSSKELESNTMQLLVLLKDKVNEQHILAKYADYSPTKVKRVNKTNNQYRATFSCVNGDCGLLYGALEADRLVVSYLKTIDSKDPNIMTTKGSKASKTKPLINK